MYIYISVHAPYFYSYKLIPYENETYCKLNWGLAFDHIETHRGFVMATLYRHAYMYVFKSLLRK